VTTSKKNFIFAASEAMDNAESKRELEVTQAKIIF